MNRTQCNNELGAVRISKNSLLRGFAIECKQNFDNLTVEFNSDWHGKYGYLPSILIKCNGIPVSVMSPKIAYRYIRYGMFYQADVTIPVKGV
jgi:hypothetical protein